MKSKMKMKGELIELFSQLRLKFKKLWVILNYKSEEITNLNTENYGYKFKHKELCMIISGMDKTISLFSVTHITIMTYILCHYILP